MQQKNTNNDIIIWYNKVTGFLDTIPFADGMERSDTLNWKMRLHTGVISGAVMLCLSLILPVAGCSGEDADAGNSSTQEIVEDTNGLAGSADAEDIQAAVLAMLPEEYLVSAEEADFYRDLYKKEYGSVKKEDISDDDLKEFISRYHAEFYLAKYLGVREDDSYESLKEEWKQENASRQEMKQNGEIFYGPVEYEFTDYFEYIYSNLKLKNIDELVVRADEQLIAGGKDYYEENSADYDDLLSVTCKLSDGERTEEKVFSYDDIKSLQKTNETVLNFIMGAEPGECMEYMNGDKPVTLELLSKEVDHREFEEMQGVIMKDYVQREFYDGFIGEIAEYLKISFDKE